MARVVVAGIVVAGTPLVLAGTANAAPDEVWDQIAKCESGGRWNINTGNGYAGGLQFAPSTWRAYGGSGSASGASRAQQIAVAERVLAAQGWGAWPSCSRKVGAKGKATPRTVTATRETSATRKTQTQVKPNTPAAPAPSLTKPGANYTVVPGDSLSKIAATKHLAGGWQAIYQRNQDVLRNPSQLRVGQQLTIG